MATATRTRRTRTAATKPAPEPEILEDDDVLEEEVEDLDPEPAPAPKRRGRPAKAAAKEVPAQRSKPSAEAFGTAWLTDHVNDALDTEYDSKAIRVRLRQMVELGTLERDEGRYSFSGPTDRRVLKIVKYIREAAKAEAETEDKPARKPAATTRKAATPAAKRGRPARKAAVVEEDPDLPDFDDDDIDDL